MSVFHKAARSSHYSVRYFSLAQIVHESFSRHMIVCIRDVHVQQRNHLVFAHVSNRVNLFNEKLQRRFANFSSSSFHLRREKHFVNFCKCIDFTSNDRLECFVDRVQQCDESVCLEICVIAFVRFFQNYDVNFAKT